MLPVLNLSQFNLLHYYEDRDDGLFHVIRALDHNDIYLNQIVEQTNFNRDSTVFADQPTVSIKRTEFTHADANALKIIFPDIKMAKMKSEDVTFTDKTHQVDRSSYRKHHEYSKFNDDNTLTYYGDSNEIRDIILSYAGIDYHSMDQLTLSEMTPKVQDVVDRFNKGEFSNDTWPVWRMLFESERHNLKMDDIHLPAWQPFFAKIDQMLELTMHPGVHRLFKIKSPSEIVEQIFTPGKKVYPTNLYSSVTPLGDEVENACFHALTSKRHIDSLTIDEIVTPTKGIIEVNRDLLTGISSLVKVSDMPIQHRVRLVTSIISPVATNAYRALKIRTLLNDALTTFEDKPSQQVLGDKITSVTLEINKVLDLGKVNPPTRLTALANSPRVQDIGLKQELAAISDLVRARHTRIVRVFARNLNRTRFISDSDERKETTHALIMNYIDTARGMNLIEQSPNHAKMFSASDASTDQEDELKALFDDIDKPVNIQEMTGWLQHEVAQTITKELNAYRADREQDTLDKLKRQQEEARASFQPVQLNIMDDEDIQPIEKPTVHTDVGEKIGGARKDLYNHITTSNVNQLTFEEQIKYVTKARIWPTPNWAAMIASGVKAYQAYFLKRLRDDIEPQAHKLSNYIYRGSKDTHLAETKDDYLYWLRSVEFIRDKVATIKTADDVRPALEAIAEFLDTPCSDAYEKNDNERFLGSLKDNNIKNLHALGNSFKSKYHFGDEIIRKFIQLDSIAKYYSNHGDTYYKKKLRIRATAVKVEDDKAQVEGENSVNQEKQEAVVKPKKPGLPYPPHLKSLERKGNDWRKDRDVTGEDLMETFGFRGIEYGNWVANRERQIVLNHAYDALMDLAYLIGLPKDKLHMISMNGNLAIGFGSRGHGKALAHYEPLRNVINITKIKGAGSLAHEWFHAFDDYLGKLTGMGHPRQRLFSEAYFEKYGLNTAKIQDNLSHIQDNTVLIMASALLKTLKGTMRRPRTQEDIDRNIEELYNESVSVIGSWSRSTAHKYMKENYDNPPHPTMQEAKVVEILKALDLENDGDYSVSSVVGKVTAMQIAEAMNMTDPSYARQVQNLESLVVDYMSPACLKNCRLRLSWLDNNLSRALKSTESVETDYYKEAQKLDGKSRKYWQIPCELLARAFSVSIYEKLELEGRQSDYLVRGAARNEFDDKSKYKGNSNPEGAERDLLNESYDDLLTAIYQHALTLPALVSQTTPNESTAQEVPEAEETSELTMS